MTGASTLDPADAVGGERPRPLLRIVRGSPTEDELAALVAVVAAAAGRGTNGDNVAQPATWAAYWRGLRRPFEPGSGAWKRSTWPR